MSKLDELKQKANSFELKKSWQYQLYITLVLPLALFALAFLLKASGMGVTFARMFHTYNLYVASPIPNFSPFNGTGVLGLAILIGLSVWAVRRRDWKDLALTLVLGGANAVYFWMEWNYALLRLLNMTGGVL